MIHTDGVPTIAARPRGARGIDGANLGEFRANHTLELQCLLGAMVAQQELVPNMIAGEVIARLRVAYAAASAEDRAAQREGWRAAND